jgi:hypothetical protein
MPFYPWQQHQVECNHCADCGMEIPEESKKDGVAYSHHHENGQQVFSQEPKGRTKPCTAKPS